MRPMGRSLGAVLAALVFLASFAAPASASTPNTWTALGHVVPKGPGYGAVSVSVDGAAATRLGLNSARRAPQLALYVVNFPSSGRHTVVIRARAVGSRRRVELDAFAVVG